MATIKTILYPRPALTRVITQWSDGEWDLLMTANREAALFAIRGTVDRLVLPARCTRMRQEILSGGGGGPAGDRAGREPRKELLGILLGNLRYHGYIYREDNRWRLSPLTPRQIHLVGLMTDGYTLKSAATRLGVTHSTTRRICQTAMETIGVHTSTALVGKTLYQGWMPGRSESENLERNLGDTLGPGYITR
jgi:DNA-binding NarL/FixJ family response regulator